MPNSTRGVSGWQGSAFPRPDVLKREPFCFWRGCNGPLWADTPVCFAHALNIASLVNGCMNATPPEEPKPPVPQHVYYLMVGPNTVKIGTTKRLSQRINELRSDRQYVVALEPGGRTVERERHLQFAAERLGRREDFRLSDRLKQHIESLQPKRDALIRLAG